MITAASYLPGPNSLDRIRRLRLIALLPVLFAALINTGYQYAQIHNADGNSGVSDWRDQFILNLGYDISDPGVYGILVAGAVHLLSILFVAILIAGFVERISCSSQHRRFDTGIIYSAFLFSLLMPPAATVFHIVFGMTLGLLLGQIVFGGEGKSFLSPALVGAAIVQISFPAALTSHPVWTDMNGYAGTTILNAYHTQGLAALAWADMDWWSTFIGNSQGLIGTTSTLAVIIGGAVLLYAKVASWRLIIGQLLGVIIAAAICNAFGSGILDLPWHWHIVIGSFAFGAVFIATDPSSSCATNPGRWAQGILIGLLLVLLRVVNPSHPDGVIPVLLMASMLAPTIDHIVMWLNIRQRAHADGR